MTPAELAADLRTRINPKYADQRGCESYLNRVCAEAIEGLIAELEKVTREAHENKDKARWANAELERVTTLARGQHVELYNARLELERLKSQEPVAWQDAAFPADLYWRKPDQVDVKPLFRAAGAQKDVTETAFGNMAQERKPLPHVPQPLKDKDRK